MPKIKRLNLTKNDIVKEINLKTGLSNSYINRVVDNIIQILKDSIRNKEVNIKNFGTFKTMNKSERLGRNPKNNKTYKIKARKSLSFIISKKFNDKINNL
jgi:nucleoid DNA-binding protein